MCNPTIAAIAPRAINAVRTFNSIKDARRQLSDQQGHAVQDYNEQHNLAQDNAAEDHRLLAKQADAERTAAKSDQAKRRANSGRSGLTITGSKLDVLNAAASQDREEILDKVTEGKRLIDRRLDQHLDQARNILDDRLDRLGDTARQTIRSKRRSLLDSAWSRLFGK